MIVGGLSPGTGVAVMAGEGVFVLVGVLVGVRDGPGVTVGKPNVLYMAILEAGPAPAG